MYIIVALVFIIGIVVGILFGRKNKNKVNYAVNELTPVVEKLEGNAKENLENLLNKLKN